MSSGRIPPEGVVDLVFFSILFNLLTMAVGFSIVAGIATFSPSVPSSLATAFGPASGFLILLATVVGTLRTAIIRLLGSLVVESQAATEQSPPKEQDEDVDELLERELEQRK